MAKLKKTKKSDSVNANLSPDSLSPDLLSPDPSEIREIGRAALDLVASYYESLATRVLVEPTTSAALRPLFDGPLPVTGEPFADLLETVQHVIARFSRPSPLLRLCRIARRARGRHRQHDRRRAQHQRHRMAFRTRRHRN
jgi:hypothetical protein